MLSLLLMMVLLLPSMLASPDSEKKKRFLFGDNDDGYGAPVGPPVHYQPVPSYDSYTAPSIPPQYQPDGYETAPAHDYDYYKHEHHHYYHAGPPRVYKVPVPVTQKPHIVHVPQNVPVKFVGVNVPVPPQPQFISRPIEVTPQYGGGGGVFHHDAGVFHSGGGGGGLFGGGGLGLLPDFSDPYVKRKELIKGGLLLGAGLVKGAVITTLITNAANAAANNRNNNNN